MERFFYDLIQRGKLQPGECWQYLLMPVAEGTVETRRNFHRHCMAFHFACWLQENPEVTNFGFLISHDSGAPIMEVLGQSMVVMFGRKSDFNSFKRYMAKLNRWFPEDELVQDNMIPTFPTSGTHKLTFIAHPASCGIDPATFEPVKRELMEAWAWIVHNCHRPVFRTPLGFAFTSDKDALFFKMKYG